jgi:molybdate transport system substrate-binding protein
MKTRSVLFSLVALVSCTPFVRAEQLQVFAAASLTDALKEIAPAYEAASGGKLQFNFAGSTALARQIQEGRLMSSSRRTKRRWTPFKRLGRF